MSVRLAMAVVGLVGAVTVFAWGAGGDEPYTPSFSEGQKETLCEQAAVGTAEVARQFEDETGQPGKGVTKEQCLAAYGQRSR